MEEHNFSEQQSREPEPPAPQTPPVPPAPPVQQPPQYPPQYPQGQYPPRYPQGQYPSQYPQGQYPPGYPQGQYPYPPQPVFPPPDLKTARKRFSTLGLGVFIVLVVANLLQVVAGIIAGIVYMNSEMPSWLQWVLTAVPMYAVAMPVGMLIIYSVPAQPLEGHRIGIGKLLMVFLICIACMYGGNLVGILVTTLLEVLFGITSLNPVVDIALGGGILPMAIVTVILAPIFEELIFRKLLIDRMRCYGEKAAIITSALMFGLIHGNLSQLFYAFAVGLVLGYIYLRSGKLRYTIGLHMGVNFLGGALPALLMDGLDLNGLDSMGSLMDVEEIMALFTPQLLLYLGFAMTMICLAIGGAVLLIVHADSVRFRRAPMELPRGKRFRTIFLNVGMILLILACIGSMVLMCLIL